MKINVKAYEAKRYYSLNDVKNGEEVIELEMPRKVLFDPCDYLALDEEKWKALKSKLGITKSDDEVTYEDVVGDNELWYFANEMRVKGFLYRVDSDEPCFVDEIMDNAYIIFCSDYNDVIRVFKGEELSSCYYGVCHQPFEDKFWSIGDDYYDVVYYKVESIEDGSPKTDLDDCVKTFLILEPDNKKERLRVLRGIHGRDQDSFWVWSVMSVEHYNENYADEDEE